METIISAFFRLVLVVLLASCGKASNSINQCGRLRTIQPTLLGRNVTFSFTPDTNDPDAQLEWRRKNDDNPWAVLPLQDKFTQYHKYGTYYLVLADTVRSSDEVYYQVHYYNESMHCYMHTPKLILKDISSNQCGFVYLRTTRLIEGETVEIEYYPSKIVLDNPGGFRRTWIRVTKFNTVIVIQLAKGLFEEETEQNDKYVLKIFLSNSRINGRYRVFCGDSGYSSFATVIILVPPSMPTFEGLHDIDGCEKCIVGENGEQMQVHCKTSGGTEPIDVNISVGSNLLKKPEENDIAPGYIALFTMHARYHMENLTLTIMNKALVSPLSVTARVYVLKPPESLLIMAPTVLKEDCSVNITCISDGGRPASKLTMNISGIEVSPEHHTKYFNVTTNLNTNIVSLTTFKRIWNQENITCCRYNEWFTNKMECSPPKQVNYLFPPSKIRLTVEVKFEERQQHETQAICRIYDSNPACVTNFNVPNGIMVTEMYKHDISKPHGAWDSEYAIHLNTSKENNGTVIRCMAECTDFDVDLNDTAFIILPYAPVMKINMSEPIVNVHKGEQEHAKCSAQSVPASNITWLELIDNDRDVNKKQCLSATECVMTIDTTLVLKRHFLCEAQYLNAVDHKILIVNIKEKEKEHLKEDKSFLACKSFIWIIVGAILGVFLILHVILLIARKRRRNSENAKRKGESTDVDVLRRKDEERENHLKGKLNEVADDHGSPEATYTQLDVIMAATGTDGLYSELSTQ